jgi:hypothetical protein
MAVVINEFEVAPEPPKKENQAAKKEEKGGGQNQPPTDYELKQMLQRRAERLERISAH